MTTVAAPLALDMVDLSSHIPTLEEILILSKCLTFCPNNKLGKFTVIKDLHLYTRKLLLKSMFDKHKHLL